VTPVTTEKQTKTVKKFRPRSLVHASDKLRLIEKRERKKEWMKKIFFCMKNDDININFENHFQLEIINIHANIFYGENSSCFRKFQDSE